MALTSTLAELAPQVSARLQDDSNIFWSLDYEVYAGLAEGISELLLIIGRPTQTVNLSVFLTPNTVWQILPANLLAISDIRTSTSRLVKTSLRALDNTQTSWNSAWESDRAAKPARWAPVGLTQYIVHPAPLQPIQVQITGIAYPFTGDWPPSGTDTSPFHKEVDQALQLYAAAYARFKEIGNDAMEGFSLYQSFLEIGQRLSIIEDRKDSLVWTRSMGVATSTSQVSRR